MVVPSLNRLGGGFIADRVAVEMYSPKFENRYFIYLLYEGQDKNLAQGTKIELTIDKLIGSKNLWNDAAETHIKNKLEASLKGLFGKEKGYKVYETILKDYIAYSSNKKQYTKDITIDNIKININSEYSYCVSFVF